MSFIMEDWVIIGMDADADTESDSEYFLESYLFPSLKGEVGEF